VEIFYATGYTPYPTIRGDQRLPHERDNSLARSPRLRSARQTVRVEHATDVLKLIHALKDDGFVIAALEQSPSSVTLSTYRAGRNLRFAARRRSPWYYARAPTRVRRHAEIPMVGHKESFNVSVAAGIALYGLTTP